VAGFCKYGNELSGSRETELVIYYSLFNDVFSNIDYIASKERMIIER
jgi:hypothetical protein